MSKDRIKSKQRAFLSDSAYLNYHYQNKVEFHDSPNQQCDSHDFDMSENKETCNSTCRKVNKQARQIHIVHALHPKLTCSWLFSKLTTNRRFALDKYFR